MTTLETLPPFSLMSFVYSNTVRERPPLTEMLSEAKGLAILVPLHGQRAATRD